LEEVKINIREIDKEGLEDSLKKMGQASFRSQQIWTWLWAKGVSSFEEMRNIPKELQEELKSRFEIKKIEIVEQQKSQDGTIKCGFRLWDSEIVEGVLIPTDKRITACISSQVGCSLACSFCATGFLPRKRNLDSSEIYDQVFLLNQLSKKEYDKPLSNIVYMGMGEPLLNYGPVLRSADMISNPEGMNMSPSRLTISTAGIVKMIRKMTEGKPKYNLALSLHAANDEKRNQIMEINKSNDLEGLIAALSEFYTATKNKITFEYILLKDFNDSLEDAAELVKIARRIPSKVNLIEYNTVDGTPFLKTGLDRAEKFREYLVRRRIPASLRRSRGKDIDAACGQLAGRK
jgi:23S rRNA (adenine2503-C2)-methyltransferase